MGGLLLIQEVGIATFASEFNAAPVFLVGCGDHVGVVPEEFVEVGEASFFVGVLLFGFVEESLGS